MPVVIVSVGHVEARRVGRAAAIIPLGRAVRSRPTEEQRNSHDQQAKVPAEAGAGATA